MPNEERIAILSTPVRLGYFLERRDVTISWWPEQMYNGIDRLPFVPSPEQDELLLAAGQGDLVQLWIDYWDALETGELNACLAVAGRLRQAFRAKGHDFDFIYAEIVAVPNYLEGYPHGQLWMEDMRLAADHLNRISELIDSRPGNITPLGVDISHPTIMFHSAIFQPGLNRRVPSLPRSLNHHGLFSSITSALPFISDANEMDYGAFPFCGIEIWRAT